MNSKRDKILYLIDSSKDLPGLPTIISKLRELLADINTNIDDIAELINYDISLTANLIKIANTTKFNYSTNRVSSLNQAISQIGFNNISDIVFTIKLINLFNKKSIINYSQFWLHSLVVGFCMAKIKELFPDKYMPEDELYTTGLLHDIGTLILDQACPKEYLNVLNRAQEYPEKYLKDIELDVLGISSAEAGAHMLSKWKLPHKIINSVANINSPFLATVDPPLCNLLHIINFSCNNQGIHNSVDKCFPESFSESAWENIQLDINDISKIITEIQNENTLAWELLSQSFNDTQHSPSNI